MSKVKFILTNRLKQKSTLFNLLLFWKNKSSPLTDVLRMREDYVNSKFNIIGIAERLIILSKRKLKITKSTGLLGLLENSEVNAICNEIDTNGYYCFNKRLDEKLVNELVKIAKKLPLEHVRVNDYKCEYSGEEDSFENSKDNSNRFQLLNAFHLEGFDAYKNIVLDENFLHIANNYFKTLPILDILTLWWSQPLSNVKLEAQEKNLLRDFSAQMFHFDMQRLKFLKFFIYLTDVDENSGPHVFVKSTHKKLPNIIKEFGRYEDEFIDKNFGDDVIEICGKKGTIIAVDTRGLHKGKELKEKERLIFQLQFCNSLFGFPAPQLKNKLSFAKKPISWKPYQLFFE